MRRRPSNSDRWSCKGSFHGSGERGVRERLTEAVLIDMSSLSVIVVQFLFPRSKNSLARLSDVLSVKTWSFISAWTLRLESSIMTCLKELPAPS